MKTTLRQVFYDIARQICRTPSDMEVWVEKKLERCILHEWEEEATIRFNYVGIKDKGFDCPPFVLYIENSSDWSVYATKTIKNLKKNIISALHNSSDITELKVSFQGKPINFKIWHYYIANGKKENPMLKYGNYNIYDNEEEKTILVEIGDIIEVEDTAGNKGYFKSILDVGYYLCGDLHEQTEDWYTEKLKQEIDEEEIELYKIRVNDYDGVFNITDDGFIEWVGQNPRIDEVEKFPEHIVSINLLSNEIKKLLVENNVEFEADSENYNFKVSKGSIDISNYTLTNKTEKEDWM